MNEKAELVVEDVSASSPREAIRRGILTEAEFDDLVRTRRKYADLMALIHSYQDESLVRMFEESDTLSTRMEYEEALRQAHEKGWNDALREMRDPRGVPSQEDRP